MYYGLPKEQTLSVTYGGQTYTKRFYRTALSTTNITDELHPNWAVGYTFAEGEFCIVPELKTIYRATAAHSGSFPPATGSKWIEWSAINSACAFDNDTNIGSKTTGTDIVFEIDFSLCNIIGLIDCNFLSMRVEEIDNTTATTIIDKTISGITFGCKNFAGYFFNPIKRKKIAVIDGLKWKASSKIRLTFSGYAEIGTIVVSKKTDLAITLSSPQLSLQSESKIATDADTGYRNILRYGVVKVVEARVAFDAIDYNTVADNAEEIMDKTVLWVPSNNEKVSSMITLGYIERFKIPAPAKNQEKIATDITIVGVQA
jgi:hypothetical protein